MNCSDCPPENYPTDVTRCLECPKLEQTKVVEMKPRYVVALIPEEGVACILATELISDKLWFECSYQAGSGWRFKAERNEEGMPYPDMWEDVAR